MPPTVSVDGVLLSWDELRERFPDIADEIVRLEAEKDGD